MTENIIVIGAGASGLIAAKTLLERGYTVTIIESRDRIGGRIHTLNSPFTNPAEAGAEFIHGNLPVTTSLVQEAKLQTLAMHGRSYQIHNGLLGQNDMFNGNWDEMMHALHSLKQDMPIRDFLDQQFPRDKNTALYDSVIHFVEGYDAADTRQISAFALREEWDETDDDHQLRIKHGYQDLTNYLYDTITRLQGQFLFSSPVKRITWNKSIRVETTQGLTVEGDRIIITVPIAILQRNEIEFSPAIPAYIEAAQKIGFGGVIKFLFEFNERIWENASPRKMKEAGFIFSDASIPTWWSQHPDERSLLTGWLAGPKTYAKIFSHDELFDEALHVLAYILDMPKKEILDSTKAWHIANWVNDPYARGAYAYATVQTKPARELLLTPLENKVYFAGEALYEGPAMGTVEAALTSGLACAKKIGASQNTVIEM